MIDITPFFTDWLLVPRIVGCAVFAAGVVVYELSSRRAGA